MAKQKNKTNALAVGTRIEVTIDGDGFIGSWYEATITCHVMQSGQLSRYSIEYLNLIKEENSEIRDTDEVSLQDVWAVAPRSLCTQTDNENEDEGPEFELHDLVEAYHNDGWWYGVISCLKSEITGKYTVSLPIAREVLDLSPSEIRPQFDFINGSFVSPQRKTQQEEETYKSGDKVEACLNREKYGLSWYPAKVEKRIGDDYFLVTYENKKYLPNGHETEILDEHLLRPVVVRNTGKIAVNSDVEFFHEGAWSPRVVTDVDLLRGVYVNTVGKGTDVVSELVPEDFVRLRLTWNWEEKTFSKKVKRRRSLQSSKNCSVKKKRKTNLSKDSIRKKPMNSETEEIKQDSAQQKAEDLPSKSGTVKKYCGREALNCNRSSEVDNSKDSCKSPGDVSGDIINGKMVNSSMDNTPTPTPEQTSSLVCAPNITLPFEGRSPFWKSVDAMPIFKLIPQKPHFKDLDKKMRDYTALGLAMNCADIADSIDRFSLNVDVAFYEEKLFDLDTLKTHGFNIDPLRTCLNKLLGVKQEISEMVSRTTEKKKEVAWRTEHNKSLQAKVVKIDADLAEVEKKMNELQQQEESFRGLRESCWETSVANENFISRITHEIFSIRRDEEADEERFSATLRKFYGK